MVRRDPFWPLALLALAALLLALPRPRLPAAAPADAPQAVADGPKLIALTFDDGPKAATTRRLLEGLEQRGVRATFFLIGKQIPGNEALIQTMVRNGHQLGVHTYDHVALTGLNRADFDSQVERTRQLLLNIPGVDSLLLRPPYGAVDDGVRHMAGCPVILWSVDPEDWHERDVAREVEHIVAHAADGAIILMHDIFPESVDAALEAVDRLHRAGYAFVTVEELFAARDIPLQAGNVYRSCPPG